MTTSSNISAHFSKVAREYNELRTTDPEPVEYMAHLLAKNKYIRAADVGCGPGRYDLSLFEKLGNKLHLVCCDANEEMLRELQQYLKENSQTNFETVHAKASDLPLKDHSFNCVFTFNAIHHFDFPGFLSEAERILKKNGHLFIYTRTRSQNSQTLWGCFFPKFSKKESRLYELNELEKAINSVSTLEITSIEQFHFKRSSSLKNLLNHARSHHYSTFSLYRPDEFDQACQKFEQEIRHTYKNLDHITWEDQNTLMVVRKI